MSSATPLPHPRTGFTMRTWPSLTWPICPPSSLPAENTARKTIGNRLADLSPSTDWLRLAEVRNVAVDFFTMLGQRYAEGFRRRHPEVCGGGEWRRRSTRRRETPMHLEPLAILA